MTTYPLATLAAQITSTGISAPSYADILASLTASYKAIYGSDTYLENDSQDGQLIAVFAKAINDSNNLAIAVYNSYSPATAQGVGLSNAVKINGLQRLVSSNSTASVTIVGVAGTTITNGIVQDTNGNKWNLPASFTIPIGGSVIETVTAQELGDITAAANTITKILTPTRGWQTVNNATAAIPGAPVEGDATLRRRQSVSTGLPAQTVLESIVGAIANLAGVQRYAPYENDGDVTDSNGLPPHSISLVVEGGDVVQIAQTIERKKPPGTGTYGTTTEVVVDPVGVPVTINFYQPTVVPIDLHITITALLGYVSTTGNAVVAAIVAGNNTLPIGHDVYIARQFTFANLIGSGLEDTFNVTSITMRRGAGAYTAADIVMAFNELASQAIGNIVLTVV